MQTIESVINQTYKNTEIIVLDDGSTDNSFSLIKNIASSNPNVNLVKHENRGVSATRNEGLDLSQGEFIVFLDADDVLGPAAIHEQVELLTNNASLVFSTVNVIKIDSTGKQFPAVEWTGVTDKIADDILGYNVKVTTCPSAYMFRRQVLISKSLRFNTQLASTADRFFLLEAARHGTGGLAGTQPHLFYRVHEKGMSAVITPALVNDNRLYCEKVKALEYLTPQLRKRFYFKTNYIFAGCYLKLRKPQFIKYLTLAFFQNPVLFFRQLVRR